MSEPVTTELQAPAVHETRRDRLALAAKKMGVLSVAATVLASGIATYRAGGAENFARAVAATVEPGQGQTSFGVDRMHDFGVTWHPLSPRLTSEQTTSSTREVSSTSTTDVEIKDGAMPWALEFSHDAEAVDTKRASQAINQAVEQIRHYEFNGFQLEGVSVKGFASDEDNQPGGGLNEPSPLNVKLADTRAKAVEALLSERLKGSGLEVPKIHIERGEEVIDHELNQRIADLATHKGVSVLDLIERYNSSRESFSKEDLKILDGLASDRYVRIELKFKDVLPAHAVTTKKHHGGSIIIVPILIPWFRRKKGDPRNSEDAPTEPVVEQVPEDGGSVPIKPRPTIRRERLRPVSDRAPRDQVYAQRLHMRKQPRPHNFHGSSHKRTRGKGVRRARLHSGL